MSKDLMVYPPIKIPSHGQAKGSGKIITSADVAQFWRGSEARQIARKQGCYVFALRAAKGFKVWYVGRATKSFVQECFAPHKLIHYNEVLFDGRKGTPVLFIVAPSGTKRKVPASTCDAVETFLIQAAYVANPDLKNRQKTKIPTWTIAGVVRPSPGPIPATAKQFRGMMGL